MACLVSTLREERCSNVIGRQLTFARLIAFQTKWEDNRHAESIKMFRVYTRENNQGSGKLHQGQASNSSPVKYYGDPRVEELASWQHRPWAGAGCSFHQLMETVGKSLTTFLQLANLMPTFVFAERGRQRWQSDRLMAQCSAWKSQVEGVAGFAD